MVKSLGDFTRFIGTKYESHILPILPAKAKVLPREDGTILDESNLGKIPGRYFADAGGWMGFRDWPSYRTKRSDLERWDRWHTPEVRVPIGLSTGEFPAIDLDVNRPDIAEELYRLALMELGAAPVRTRENSPRRTLIYKWVGGIGAEGSPVTKDSVTFTDDEGAEHKVEDLGRGQQTVIEGPHKSGVMHEWPLGDLLDWEHKLTVINGVAASKSRSAVTRWVESEPGFTIKRSLPSSGNGHTTRDAIPIGRAGVRSPLAVPIQEMALLRKAVKAIDINAGQLADYDSWFALLVAIKAACDGDQQFFLEVVWPWLEQNAENAARGMEWAEEKWKSIKSATIGYETVYHRASVFGMSDGAAAITRAIFKNLEVAAADAISDGDNGTNPSPGVVGGGGPVPLNDTHRAIVEAFVQQFGSKWRFNTDAKRWLRYDKGIWQPDDTILHDIRDMTFTMSQLVLSTVAGQSGANRSRALESNSTYVAVRNILQADRAMVVREEDFDAHPHLLNTPDGIIDLRTGVLSDPDPALLMRQITLCGPDWNLATYLDGGQDLYEQLCPRFFSVLKNIANGRLWVKEAIRVWYGYCLTGEIRHHGLLFVQGPPGIGKSQILYVLFHLLRTYAKKLTDAFLSKNGGESKRFDMASIIGKRMLFKDETMLGMSWDETRISDMASGEVLVAELKFGREVDFRNNGKICVVGNHRPHFVAGEAGGLTDRMLLLEAQGKKIRHTEEDVENYAAEIVDKEGPAILMWALEACIADYGPDRRQIYREAMAPLAAAALEYTQENSLYRQWVESGRMRVKEGLNKELRVDLRH